MPPRLNRGRQIEGIAVDLIRSIIGELGQVIHTGGGHGPDFRIEYSDNRLGIGEVTWHEDPAFRAMWNELMSREPVQQLGLEGEIGQWSVHLNTGTHIGRAYEAVPDFLARFAASTANGADVGMTIEPTWPIGPFADEARRIGIESFHRFSMHSPAIAVMQPISTGGALPEDPNIIVEWIESVVGEPRYFDLTEKLRGVRADEKHIFVVTGSATRYEADYLFQTIQDALPTRDPTLPAWITHAWVMSAWGSERFVGRWERNRGWSAVPPPESTLAGDH